MGISLEQRIENVANGITNSGEGIFDSLTKILSLPYAIYIVGSLRAEDQENFVQKINQKPKPDGSRRNWKAKYLTLSNALLFGVVVNVIEHGLEAEASSQILDKSELLFYGWAAYNLLQSIYRIGYSLGKNGKPIASFSMMGATTNGFNYFYKKIKKRKT